MTDLVLQKFLEQQYEEGMLLASQCDRLDLMPTLRGQLAEMLPAELQGIIDLPAPEADGPPDCYTVRYQSRTMLRSHSGQIQEVEVPCFFAITFSADHLHRAEPLRIVTWLGPTNIFHPNIAAPGFCCGHVVRGTGLVDLLYQCSEIIGYMNWASHDALNGQAAQWARQNQDRFPIERRPLKGPANAGKDEVRATDFEVTPLENTVSEKHHDAADDGKPENN